MNWSALIRSALALGAWSLVPSIVLAQPAAETVIAEEPTNGLRMPTFGISGEVGASTTVLNPGGLHFLEGPSATLVVDEADADEVQSAGQGVGLYGATRLGGRVLPRVGFGIAVEFLDPARNTLAPDPGSPTRLTLGSSTPLGRHAALGLAYQRYWDEQSPIDGTSSWTAGIATRLGAYFAGGLVVRDIGAPTVGDSPVQRRYEAELLTRPLATDRLDIAVGGRVGEVRGDLDAWLRWSVKLMSGLYLRGEVSSVELNRVSLSPALETVTDEIREHRLSLGFEVSFGGLGVIGLASGALDHQENQSFRGGTVALRVGPVGLPSVFGEGKRIERIELSGGVGDRKLTSLVASMRNISIDPDVVAVVVQIENLGGGWATMMELRRALLRIRAQGKKVFAYLSQATTGQYFVATAADKIYLDVGGGIRLVGLGSMSLYFHRLFEMIGVNAQFIKIDEYKSAPEQYTRTGPSEPAWRQRNELLDSIYRQFLAAVSESRGMTEKEVAALVDGGPYTAGDLEKQPKVVDAVVLPDEVDKLIAKELGRRYPVRSAAPTRSERWAYPRVAIIYITGDIVGGKSRSVPVLGTQLVGGETIAEAIAAARADRSIGAIILRINSPGGSAFASEVMSREVFKTRGVKPILCSFGDYAASGGYFAAAGCDTILAQGTTITGSIGIFNGTVDVTKLINRLGIDTTTYRRGKNADLEGYFRTWTKEERAMLLTKIRYFYDRFVAAVAKGRKMTEKEVDEVGRGHVWSGADAKQLGLVDDLGGLVEAIQLAKKRIGVPPDGKVELVPLPNVEKSLIEKLVGNVPGLQTQPQIVLPIPGGDQILRALPASLWEEPGVPQARLPFAVIWD